MTHAICVLHICETYFINIIHFESHMHLINTMKHLFLKVAHIRLVVNNQMFNKSRWYNIAGLVFPIMMSLIDCISDNNEYIKPRVLSFKWWRWNHPFDNFRTGFVISWVTWQVSHMEQDLLEDNIKTKWHRFQNKLWTHYPKLF